MEKYNCPVWTDKNGDYHPLCTMSDSYLTNVVKFLKRGIEAYTSALDSATSTFFSPSEGSMAEYYLEREIDDMCATLGIYKRTLNSIKNWIKANKSELYKQLEEE